MSSMKNFPELLADMAARIGESLEQQGIAPEKAAEVGMQAAEHVRKNYGGQMLYLPKGHFEEHERRDYEIWDRFNGRNHAELADHYGLSVVRIYQIIKAIQAKEVRRRQPDMFPKKEASS